MKYDNYRKLKSWHRLFEPNDADERHFEQHIGRTDLQGITLLDIGFGAGQLMAWARKKGAVVHGVEIQPSLLIEAAQQGFTVYQDLDCISPSYFDIVTAFDVLEHIQRDQLEDFIKKVYSLLHKDGKFICRVPNCQSPSGLINQFGDHTHVTMLSGPIVQAIAYSAGFESITYHEVPETADRNLPILSRLRESLRQFRLAIAHTTYRLFWTTGNTPLTANVMIRCTKA